MTCIVRVASIGVAALALMSTSAMAEMHVAGNVSADYNNLNVSGGGDGTQWNLDGNLVFPLGDSFGIQAGGGYHNLDTGVNVDGFHFGGAAFWRSDRGDIGLGISHGNFSAGGGVGDLDITAYGAFGEFFAGDSFTISAQGGWFNGSNSFDGNYLGAGAKFYAMPNLSIGVAVDRVSFSHGGGDLTNWGARAEWQVSDHTPLSVYAGYTNTNLSGISNNVNTWTIGLKLRFGEADGTTLVMGDRTNAVPNATVNYDNVFGF